MVSLRIALLLLCLACAAAPIRGQDFDLSDAFDDPKPTKTPTKKPAVPNKPPPPADGGFDLGDALAGGEPDHVTKKPVPRPHPGGTGGDFGDADLFEAAGVDPNKPNPPSGRASDASGGEGQSNHANTEAQPSVIAGVVSAVGVALVGAVSSFIAYQKKKLCFSGSGGDPENVNMEQHGGNKTEPQVQRTLLE